MKKTTPQPGSEKGFTLIELSIVLVIIGLIVGGVLVGQDLIKAAELRATISQFEKYNTAVNTFRLKYNGMPGDLSSPVTFFASVTNGGESAQGDGDGLIEGTNLANTVCTLTACHAGEAAVFWYMLSNAGMISEGITNTDYEALTLAVSDATIPASKAGSGRVMVNAIGGRNYFVLAATNATAFASGTATFTAALTPTEAYQLDSKVDDGSATGGTTTSIAIATALPGTAAGGSAAPSGAGIDDCYDTDTGAYSVGVSTSNDVLNCNLGIRASF